MGNLRRGSNVDPQFCFSTFFTMYLALLLILLLASRSAASNRSFIISGDVFLKDGAPFQVLSGSVHYFRHQPLDVPDRLRKAKLCGLNAVQTYVHWALHEPQRGVHARLGELTAFLAAAQAEGLLVVLRPGPFICGETTGGGLPGWLQEVRGGAGPQGVLIPRSGDPAFLNALDAWFAVLLPLLKPYLYSQGGPVIMAQVGNEEGYWSSDAAANPYLAHVHSAMEAAWGEGAVILHTTDGTLPALLHGGVPTGAFATVDFGPTDNATEAFAVQRAANGGAGPRFNSELYIGGMNAVWGNAAYANDTAASRNASLAAYQALIASGASLSLYMFSGGTNWRLEAGLHADGSANWQTGPYVPGGPLSEAGDFTELGIGVCAALAAAAGAPQPPPLPPPAPKTDYGYSSTGLRVAAVAPLWAALAALGAQPTPPRPGPPPLRPWGWRGATWSTLPFQTCSPTKMPPTSTFASPATGPMSFTVRARRPPAWAFASAPWTTPGAPRPPPIRLRSPRACCPAPLPPYACWWRPWGETALAPGRGRTSRACPGACSWGPTHNPMSLTGRLHPWTLPRA